MKILLVQPSERILLGKKKVNGSIMPPLGLLTLAAVLREQLPGATVHIADYEARNGETAAAFENYDLIGITGTSVHMPHALAVAKQARVANPDACIVFGGPHATFTHEDLLRDHKEIDAVVRGEGELTLPQFVARYSSRTDLPHIEGVSTREHLSNRLSPYVADLDELPDPAYDLVDISKYQLSTHRRALATPFVSSMTSRGCPYTCAYCQTPTTFGQRLRFRSPARVAAELERLVASNAIRSVVFWDDTFTANRQHAFDLCRSIAHLGLTWMCNTRVECVTPSLLKMMAQSGCRILFYGVESSQRETLHRLNRNLSLSRVREAFRWTHEAGIATVATIMVGAPGDTFGTIEENVTFVKSLNPTYVYISIYNVTPGAAEFDRAVKQGKIRDKHNRITNHVDWSDPDRFKGPPFGLPTVNETLSRHDLQEAQVWAYEQFYGRGRGGEFE